MVFQIGNFFHFELGWFFLTVLVVGGIMLYRWLRPKDEDSEGVIFKLKSKLLRKSDSRPKASYGIANEYVEGLKDDEVVVIFDVKGPILNDRQSVPFFARSNAT